MARKTVLVCDNCGKEVDEGKGATSAPDVHRRAARRQAGRPLRRLRRQDAGHAGRAPRPATEGRRADRVVRKLFHALSTKRAQEPSGPRSRMDRWGSASSPGLPTRAKSRFCWSGIWPCSTASPILIVPNRSDVERVERDLLARSGALLGGSIGTFDDVFGADRARRRRRAAGHARRPAQPARAPHRRARRAERARTSARFAGFADSLATTFAELESGLARAGSARGRPRPALRRLPRRARPARPWDRDALRAARSRAASVATSRRGTASPCSRTASRT